VKYLTKLNPGSGHLLLHSARKQIAAHSTAPWPTRDSGAVPEVS